MLYRILMVDDDRQVLNAYVRQLRHLFFIETAQGPDEALEKIRSGATFAVIISDLKMPGTNGIEFLASVREESPDSVRMLLTGHADLQAAISAVNEGNIFRFLTKPCEQETLQQVIQDGVEQHRLIISERELLEKTLSSSVKVLTEILSLVNPDAFSRANRLSRIINHMAAEIQAANQWEFTLAGMLSQIGWVTLPPEILDKIYGNEGMQDREMEMYIEHPLTAERLLSKIPRLERVAKMISMQLDSTLSAETQNDPVRIGARMIQLASEYDKAMINGARHEDVIARMKANTVVEQEDLIRALDRFHVKVQLERDSVKRLNIKDIQIGMFLEENVKTHRGMLIASKGQEVTHTVLLRMRNFSNSEGVEEPILLRVPRI